MNDPISQPVTNEIWIPITNFAREFFKNHVTIKTNYDEQAAQIESTDGKKGLVELGIQDINRTRLQMTDSICDGFVAHECGHLVPNRSPLSFKKTKTAIARLTVANGIAMIAIAGVALFQMYRQGRSNISSRSVAKVAAPLIFSEIFTRILLRVHYFVSQQEEYRADRLATEKGYGLQLIAGLEQQKQATIESFSNIFYFQNNIPVTEQANLSLGQEIELQKFVRDNLEKYNLVDRRPTNAKLTFLTPVVRAYDKFNAATTLTHPTHERRIEVIKALETKRALAQASG